VRVDALHCGLAAQVARELHLSACADASQ
jgi:hypothetical protein